MDIKSLLAIGLIKSLGLFSLQGARRFGTMIGRGLVVSNSTLYQTTLKNLALCYPDMDEQARQMLAKRSVIETGKSMAETGVAWTGSEKEMLRNEGQLKRIVNESLFLDAVASGQGVLLLTLHFGNWEWLNCYLPSRGRIMGLYKMAKMPAFEQWMLRTRQRGGVTMVSGNRSGVERFIDHFKQGGVALLAPDQEPSEKSGVWAEFFGVPALTPKLIHHMLQSHPNGKALHVYVRRLEDGFELVFEAAETGIYSDDPSESATAMNRGFERCIASDPAQYQWDYKRFKRNPEKYYKKH